MTQKLNLPPRPLNGGCQCRQVRFLLNAPPVLFYICHCRSCQKQSASAFGQSLRVNRAALSVSGKLKAVEKTADSGNTMKYEFCPDCGTRLFHSRSAYKDTLNIKAGCLDDTGWLVPAAHIWTKSKQNWVQIPHDALTYETQPENYEAIAARWQEMTGNIS